MSNKSLGYVWVLSAEYLPHIIGGLGIASSYLTKEYGRLGLKVVVISKSPNRRSTISKGGHITTLRFPEKLPAARIASYMRKKGYGLPEILHIHSMEYVDLALHYKKAHRIPILYTCHSVITSKGSNRAFTPGKQALICKHASKVVVPTKWQRAQLNIIYPFCKGKTVVIKHGVETKAGRSKAAPYNLLFVGRVIREKGIEQLLDSIAILKRSHPKINLSIIGEGSPNYIRSLKRRTKRLGIASAVKWQGFYDHYKLHSAYQKYGAVVMPSQKESFGLVALEALAHGVPLVATQSGGLGEIVNHKVAQVIPSVRAQAIASAVHKMLNSPQKTKARVKEGKRVAASYKWSNVARRYRQLFMQLSKK